MTSPLKSFSTRMHTQAANIIGKEPIQIGALTLQAILAEQDGSLDFSDARNEPTKRMTAVVPSSALTPAVAVNALVSARGENWRIDSIGNTGGTFATIVLTTETRS